jgi:hypothetical protein
MVLPPMLLVNVNPKPTWNPADASAAQRSAPTHQSGEILVIDLRREDDIAAARTPRVSSPDLPVTRHQHRHQRIYHLAHGSGSPVRSMRLDKSSPLMQRIYPFTTTPQRGHPCAWAAGADLSLVTVSPITRTTPPYLDRSKFTAPLRLVRQHGAIVMHTAKARLKTATIQPRGCRLTIHLRRVAISF